MSIYLMYIAIILVTTLLITIIKDKTKALKLTGTLTITSSVLLIILMFILKLFINSSITIINISSVTNYIFMKFVYTSLILFLIGLTEIVISKYIHIVKKI